MTTRLVGKEIFQKEIENKSIYLKCVSIEKKTRVADCSYAGQDVSVACHDPDFDFSQDRSHQVVLTSQAFNDPSITNILLDLQVYAVSMIMYEC